MLSVWDNRYHLSPVTEDELLHGLLQNSSPNDHCLCYCRNLDGITDDLSDPSVGRYCDVINNSGQVMIDKDAQRLLQDLKHSKISQVLAVQSNFKEYNIPWKSDKEQNCPEASCKHASVTGDKCDAGHTEIKTETVTYYRICNNNIVTVVCYAYCTRAGIFVSTHETMACSINSMLFATETVPDI